MKPVDVKPSTYIDYDKENYKEDSKVKIGDHVSISKYKTIFEKVYTPHLSEEVFVIKTVNNTVPWAYVSYLNGEEIVGMFYEKELKKTNKKEFSVEKVIKKKCDKLFVKWKGYNNSCNNWLIKMHSINE